MEAQREELEEHVVYLNKFELSTFLIYMMYYSRRNINTHIGEVEGQHMQWWTVNLL